MIERGDKVVCINSNPQGHVYFPAAERLVEGQIYTVEARYPGSIRLREIPETSFNESRFKFHSKPAVDFYKGNENYGMF